MLNKLPIFLVFFLVGLAVFLAGYLFSKKNDPIGQQALINNSLVDRFDKTEERHLEPTGLFELTSGEASFPYTSTTGEILYYLPRSGEIRSLSTESLTAGGALVAKTQPGAKNIDWATNNTLLATYSTGTIFYDLGSNFSKKYADQIKNPALSKTGNKIAYSYYNSESNEGNISIADPRIESYKNVLPTRFSAWRIEWLSDDKFALTKPPTLENTHLSLFVLNSNNGALENILELKSALEVIWSGNGQKLAYSYIDPATQEKRLYFMSLTDKKETSLNSLADATQCVWSLTGKYIYCADGNSLVLFDTESPNAAPKELANSPVFSNATNLLLTKTEDYLIFKNSKDGKLYGLSLTK